MADLHASGKRSFTDEERRQIAEAEQRGVTKCPPASAWGLNTTEIERARNQLFARSGVSKAR